MALRGGMFSRDFVQRNLGQAMARKQCDRHAQNSGPLAEAGILPFYHVLISSDFF